MPYKAETWHAWSYEQYFSKHRFLDISRCAFKERYLDESDFCQCYDNFFGSAILKVIYWPQQCSRYNSFSAIARHICNSILKDILLLEILRAWIKIRANSFIKTWVNIVIRKSAKVPWKLSLAKKCDPTLQRKLHHSR